MSVNIQLGQIRRPDLETASIPPSKMSVSEWKAKANLRTHSPYGALAIATIPNSDFVITSPNMPFVPEINLNLKDNDARVAHDDGMYGFAEWTKWPGFHDRMSWHLTCIPIREAWKSEITWDKTMGTHHAMYDAKHDFILWVNPVYPTNWDVTAEDHGQIQKELLDDLRKAKVHIMNLLDLTAISHPLGDDSRMKRAGLERVLLQRRILMESLPLTLKERVNEAMDRVTGMAKPWAEALVNFREAQRLLLESLGYIIFMDTVQPRLLLPAISAPLYVLPLRGAFTADSAIVEQLYRHGIAVWYIRRRQELLPSTKVVHRVAMKSIREYMSLTKPGDGKGPMQGRLSEVARHSAFNPFDDNGNLIIGDLPPLAALKPNLHANAAVLPQNIPAVTAWYDSLTHRKAQIEGLKAIRDRDRDRESRIIVAPLPSISSPVPPLPLAAGWSHLPARPTVSYQPLTRTKPVKPPKTVGQACEKLKLFEGLRGIPAWVDAETWLRGLGSPWQANPRIVYLLPPPAIFGFDPEKRTGIKIADLAALAITWLQFRTVWTRRIFIGNIPISPINNLAWKMLLSRKTVPNPKEITRARDIIREKSRASAIAILEEMELGNWGEATTGIWGATTMTAAELASDMGVFAEVMFELHQLNFRCEILSLEMVLNEAWHGEASDDEMFRRQMKILDVWESPTEVDRNDVQGPDVWALDWMTRRYYIAAWVEFMDMWPAWKATQYTPEGLVKKDLTQSAYESRERDVVNFYCHLFLLTFHRLPTFPVYRPDSLNALHDQNYQNKVLRYPPPPDGAPVASICASARAGSASGKRKRESAQ